MKLTELLPGSLSGQRNSSHRTHDSVIRAPWQFLVDHAPWRRREPRLARMRRYLHRARMPAAVADWRSTATHAAAPRLRRLGDTVKNANAVEWTAVPGELRSAATEAAMPMRRLGQRAHISLPGGPRRATNVIALIAAGSVAGAFAMYLADPHAGRRRRALVRDRFVHIGHIFTRRVPLRVERRMRFIRGVATGVRHDAAAFAHIDGHHEAFTDDETLVARVRSEVLRDRHVKAGEIHIDAYEGIVTLRGEADSHEIGDLVTATTHVEGVRGVRNYLHTPGTPPPNKAEAYAPHPLAMDGN